LEVKGKGVESLDDNKVCGRYGGTRLAGQQQHRERELHRNRKKQQTTTTFSKTDLEDAGQAREDDEDGVAPHSGDSGGVGGALGEIVLAGAEAHEMKEHGDGGGERADDGEAAQNKPRHVEDQIAGVLCTSAPKANTAGHGGRDHDNKKEDGTNNARDGHHPPQKHQNSTPAVLDKKHLLIKHSIPFELYQFFEFDHDSRPSDEDEKIS
jgi:hypothetical protein